MTPEEIKAMRERTGTVSSDDPLVSFLYELLRDHLPAADVETLVNNSPSGHTVFTNGFLALYAKDLAVRLKQEPKKEEQDSSNITKSSSPLA